MTSHQSSVLLQSLYFKITESFTAIHLNPHSVEENVRHPTTKSERCPLQSPLPIHPLFHLPGAHHIPRFPLRSPLRLPRLPKIHLPIGPLLVLKPRPGLPRRRISPPPQHRLRSRRLPRSSSGLLDLFPPSHRHCRGLGCVPEVPAERGLSRDDIPYQ